MVTAFGLKPNGRYKGKGLRLVVYSAMGALGVYEWFLLPPLSALRLLGSKTDHAFARLQITLTQYSTDEMKYLL